MCVSWKEEKGSSEFQRRGCHLRGSFGAVKLERRGVRGEARRYIRAKRTRQNKAAGSFTRGEQRDQEGRARGQYNGEGLWEEVAPHDKRSYGRHLTIYFEPGDSLSAPCSARRHQAEEVSLIGHVSSVDD